MANPAGRGIAIFPRFDEFTPLHPGANVFLPLERAACFKENGETARGGYSRITEVTVSGNRVRAGASGTRKRSVTRPTDPLTRLALSPSRRKPFSVPFSPRRGMRSAHEKRRHIGPLRLAVQPATSNGPSLRGQSEQPTSTISFLSVANSTLIYTHCHVDLAPLVSTVFLY